MMPAKRQEKASSRLSLRPAEAKDGELLWGWRNEEDVRKWSFESGYVPYEEHKRWFLDRLNSTDSSIFIVLDGEGREIGQVRFDIVTDGAAEVGIAIAAQERGKGYGSAALQAGCQRMKQKGNIDLVIAHVKEGNQNSIDAFTEAGFLNRGLVDFKGYKAIEMIWE